MAAFGGGGAGGVSRGRWRRRRRRGLANFMVELQADKASASSGEQPVLHGFKAFGSWRIEDRA